MKTTAHQTLKDFLPTALAARELGLTTAGVRYLCEIGDLPGADQPWGPEFGWLIPRQAVAARKAAKKRGQFAVGKRRKSEVVGTKGLTKTA